MTVLQFPTPQQALQAKPRGQTAAPHVDVILRTTLARVRFHGHPGYGSARSKAIRDVFRALGWGKFFRITKGGYSLGSALEWAPGYQPLWTCERQEEARQAANRALVYTPVPVCGCADCRYREAQKRAVARRVAAVLNRAFVAPGAREFGDRSDTMSDYHDKDYTFYP